MHLWLDESGQALPFDLYARQASEAIGRHHWQIAGQRGANRVGQIASLSPYEWPPQSCAGRKRLGVLLVHGLSDSPFLMRDIGGALNSAPQLCLLTRSVLLPGHATTPGDLRAARYEDWLAAVRYGLTSFAGLTDGVVIVGFSTGGALAAYLSDQALGGPEAAASIKGLVLLSPAIRPTGWLARLSLAPRLLTYVSNATGVLTWLDIHEDLDFAKYESFPLNAALQILLLDEQLAGAPSRRLPMPMLVALSHEDTTVSSFATVEYFRKKATDNSRLFLVAKDVEQAAAQLDIRSDQRFHLLSGVIADKSILSFAHTSFVARPDNPHYGVMGDYAECLVYATSRDTDRSKFCTCITVQMRKAVCRNQASPAPQQSIVYGERLAHDVDAHLLRRLAYNPYFSMLEQEIVAFMARINPN